MKDAQPAECPILEPRLLQKYIDALPASIEAVFYMRVDRDKWECPFCMGNSWPDVEADCVDATSGPKCHGYARRAHAAILKHFHVTRKQLPLLEFNPYDWDSPFREVQA